MTRVTSLDLRCPTCSVAPGDRCRRLDAQPFKTVPPHETRRRLAAEEQARLNPEHVDGQLPLWPGKVPS